MELNKALKIGNFLVENLQAGCAPGHCMIAGGARRRKAEVHDLEIVAMSLLGAPRPEFGQKNPDRSHLERQLRILVEGGWLKTEMGGEKFKKFEIKRLSDWGIPQSINPFMLDLFIVTPPSQWGVTLMIRTGPGEFSQWMVTQRSKRGALPDEYFVKHNVVWRSGTEVPNQAEKAAQMMTEANFVKMPEEGDWFDLCGMTWIEPAKRFSKWR